MDFLKLGFTPCKAEQQPWDMQLQEKKYKKIKIKQEKLLGKNLKIKGVY